MEQLVFGGERQPWSVGAASFFMSYAQGSFTLPVAIRCRLGTGTIDEMALLDTGAQWSVLGDWAVDLLGDELDDLDEVIELSTRQGRFAGRVSRVRISLLADEDCGLDLPVEATVLVVAGWPGPTVLGYRGLLERVRFALDPGADGQPLFFFGPGA